MRSAQARTLNIVALVLAILAVDAGALPGSLGPYSLWVDYIAAGRAGVAGRAGTMGPRATRLMRSAGQTT